MTANRIPYSDDLDLWTLLRYRGAVASAIRGRRGQLFLQELARLLDAMPLNRRRLIRHDLEHPLGEDAPAGCRFCTIALVLHARGHDALSPEIVDLSTNPDYLARLLGIAPSMVQEIIWENDEFEAGPRVGVEEDARRRWVYMRNWVNTHIKSQSTLQPQQQSS